MALKRNAGELIPVGNYHQRKQFGLSKQEWEQKIQDLYLAAELDYGNNISALPSNTV